MATSTNGGNWFDLQCEEVEQLWKERQEDDVCRDKFGRPFEEGQLIVGAMRLGKEMVMRLYQIIEIRENPKQMIGWEHPSKWELAVMSERGTMANLRRIHSFIIITEQCYAHAELGFNGPLIAMGVIDADSE